MEDNQYLVQPKYILERNADYKTQQHINSVFETVDTIPDTGTSGNLGMDLHVDIKTKKVVFKERPNMFSKEGGYEKFMKKYAYLSRAIPSALALYRLICIFPNPKFTELTGSEGYKMPWEIMLRHKETGEFVGFGEWKGAFNVRGTKSTNEYDKRTLKDFIKLVNLILSEKSPHPYDGTVAGSVA